MSYNIGPKIGIDGEKEFRKQIRQIDQEYKMLQAETKALTAAFEANGDEQGKLEASGKQLQKQIDAQKEKMSHLRDALYKATVRFGENSIEANRLRGALYDTEATVTGLENELRDVQTQLRRAGESMEGFTDAADDAERATLDFGDVLGANLVSDLAVDALRNITDLLKDFAVGSIEVAAGAKAADAQFEQAFGDLEETARASLASISEDTDIASTRMQESFTRIFAFSQTVGTGAEESLDIASRAMIAAADSAAYYDRSIEEVTETLQSFLKGNFENDAALGIAATETTRNTKANELYAKSFKELSESQKVDVLLAMVEAGNAASGAIGQAARESDSWENVTGELTEALRQLQVRAGDAALEKLTHTIQRITGACYELIDEVDWDKFGDTVADVIDTVIEEGPAILRTVASVGAGIAAFKAVKKAGEMVTLASSFLKIGTAAQTAGAATAASGALAATSPWGLAALAIGGVVAIISSLAIKSVTTAEDVDKLGDAMEDFRSQAENAQETYNETTTATEGTAYAAQVYARRLEELENTGLNSAAAQQEYASTVEQLNQLIPELNLSIDEQTGLLNQNIESVYADIDAWKQRALTQALQDKFTSQLEAQGKAMAEIAVAQIELQEKEEQRLRLEKRHAVATEAYSKSTEDLTKARQALSKASDPDEVEKLTQKVRALELEQQGYYEGMTSWEEQLENVREEESLLSAQIQQSEKEVRAYDDEIKKAEDALDAYGRQTQETADAESELQAAVATTQANIDALADSYLEAQTAARESIDSQIGIFDELSNESDVSAAKIVANWEAQRKAFDAYSENLQKAVKLGLDEALVEHLSDGSEESMQILDELVNGSEVSVDDINKAFGSMDSARDALSQIIADMDIELATALENMAEDAKEAGINIADSLIEGVELRTPHFAEVMRGLGLTGQTATAEANDSHSPSRKYRQEGINNVEGLILGVDDMIAKFQAKMTQVSSAGQAAYLGAQLSRAQEYPSMYGSPTSNVNSSKTLNMGGISIQIYPQDGQDANDIAEAVWDKLQIEIARREALL